MRLTFRFFLLFVLTISGFIQGFPDNSVMGNDIDRMIESAKIAISNGKHEIARDGLEEALKKAEMEKDTLRQIKILTTLESPYVALKQWDEYAGVIMHKVDLSEKFYKDYSTEERLLSYAKLPIAFARNNRRELAFSSLELVELAAKMLNTPFSNGFYQMTKGMTHAAMNDYETAVEAYTLSNQFFSSGSDELSRHFLPQTADLLAGAQYQVNQLDRSLETYKNNLLRKEKEYGRRHQEYARALRDLANIEAFNGLIQQASSHYVESSDILREVSRLDLQILTPDMRKRYWDDINDIMWDMTPFALKTGIKSNELTEAAYNALVFSKGLLLAFNRSTGNLVLSSGNQSLIDKFTAIASMRNRIEELRAQKNGDACALLYAKIDSIESSLAGELSAEGILPTVRDLRFEDIKAELKDGEALVDFYDFKLKSNGTHIYAAFIIRKDYDFPTLVKVFEESDLEEMLKSDNGNLSALTTEYNAEAARRLLLEPLEPYLKDINRLFFVPSGVLHQLAFESIYEACSNDKQIPEIIRLSSAREIPQIASERHLKLPETAVLYGGLEYDVSAEDMISNACKSTISNLPPVNKNGNQITVRGKDKFDPLVYSGEEVDEICKILRSAGCEVSVHQGKEGTEESVRALSGRSPELLLFSTHGFYYSPENVPFRRAITGYDNPMYLTGLVMSGGNAEWMKKEIPEGVLGGLLTSADVASLDLRGTGLVILSACESGLGEISNEGVYGLQRAFKQAGAQSIIMSLWPVSDETTKEMMITFHKELVKTGGNRHAAFTKARNTIKKLNPDPFYWAGFVMID